uniref:G_PROTEIN_RECEP_F1_2 domain-containing protein n=1 Tax=Angiostrongylus cantonensis TaxID=6313 RepID=A0A0K0DMP9_ANGCA
LFPIRTTVEFTSSLLLFVSVVVNAFFIYIVYSKTRHETGSYKNVMMLFSLCNILYSTTEFVAAPVSVFSLFKNHAEEIASLMKNTVISVTTEMTLKVEVVLWAKWFKHVLLTFHSFPCIHCLRLFYNSRCGLGCCLGIFFSS